MSYQPLTPRAPSRAEYQRMMQRAEDTYVDAVRSGDVARIESAEGDLYLRHRDVPSVIKRLQEVARQGNSRR